MKNKRKKLPGYQYGLDPNQMTFGSNGWYNITGPRQLTPMAGNQLGGPIQANYMPSQAEINNMNTPGVTPKPEGGEAASGGGDIPGSEIATAIGKINEFGWSISDAFGGVKSPQQLVGESDRRSVSNGQFVYDRRSVNANRQMAELRKSIRKNTMATTATGIGAGAATGLAVGATVGSVAPGVGTAIGAAVGAIGGALAGIFGGKHRKRKMQRRLFDAQQQVNRINMANYNAAKSEWMDRQYNLNHDYTQDDSIYQAKRGKDNSIAQYQGFLDSKNHKVYTSAGLKNAPANAKIMKGEIVLDNLDNVDKATATVVKHGKPGKDSVLANLTDSSVVLGSDIDWETGERFMDLGRRYSDGLEKLWKKYEVRTDSKKNDLRGKRGEFTDQVQQREVNKLKAPMVEALKDLADRQKQQHEAEEELVQYLNSRNNMQNVQQYKGGKDGKSGSREKWADVLPNYLATLSGINLGLGRYLAAKNQDIHTPSIYQRNPYAQEALNELANLRTDRQYITNQMKDLALQARYSQNRAGGLTGAQKYLGNIALALGAQRNIQDALAKADEQDKKYRAEYASTAAQLGDSEAARKQQARQYETEYAAKAHAARQKMMETGLRDAQESMLQGMANNFKYNQFNKMMGLYQSQQDIDREKLNALWDSFNQGDGDRSGAGLKNNQLLANARAVANTKYKFDVLPTSFQQQKPVTLQDYSNYVQGIEDAQRAFEDKYRFRSWNRSKR